MKVELKIEKLVAGGDGMAFLNGKVHFVSQVLPGELVEVEITEEKKGFNRCSLTDIKEAVKERQEPFCALYNKCGGCNFQYTDYNNQLRIKEQIVRDIFLRTSKLKLDNIEILYNKDRSYRNRIQVHRKDNLQGFKKNQSDEIIDVKNCPLLVNNLNDFLECDNNSTFEREVIFSNGINYFTTENSENCYCEINNKKIYFNSSGFFQSNLSMIPQLIELVNNNIKGNHVMDLYCGSGLFSSFLPEYVENIIAVEIDSRVTEYYKKNVGNRKYSFYPMSLETYIKRKLHKKNHVDTIIVDPPRKGLSTSVRNFIKSSNVDNLIYVSCDPVTMARDIKDLTDFGYKLNEFKVLDFYPNTFHIECFGVLSLA